MRRAHSAVAASLAVRHMNLPGWKTSLSTGDARSKEQREIDRKARHIEKLPKPVALHAPQYPYDRHIIADHTMQPIVFQDHLDTPTLFNIESPADFFLYWNCNDFNRTNYPPVPELDHRMLKVDSEEWVKHRLLSQRYLQKHSIVPTYFSAAPQNVNMSAVFSGTHDVRARADDDGNVLPPPPPVSELDARNFWFTAHCGNYIDLHEVQQAPSLFLNVPEEDIKNDVHYTFVMASPDYPYRTDPNATFMLNYIMANIPASGVCDAARQGTVVVPYVAPLPTEDAGCSRQLCILYKQKGKITSPELRELKADEELRILPFAQRAAFRFHDNKSLEGKNLRANFGALTAVEESLQHIPVSITLFHTKWDIQVQEYYEKIGAAEPAYTQDESIESTLHYLARTRESFQVRSRFLADGTLNQGNDVQLFVQNAETRIGEGSSWDYRSRRHLLGHNGKEKILPIKNAKLF